MKKRAKNGLFMALGVSAVLVLSACNLMDDDGTIESEIKEDQKEDQAENAKAVEVYNKDGIQVKYLGHDYENDEFFGETLEFDFDVKNDTDKELTVQARNISADGRMVDEMLLTMSDTIAAGKIGEATLKMSEFQDIEIPKDAKEVELTLHIFDWDGDYSIDVPVKLNLK